jgi:hypothetical protein
VSCRSRVVLTALAGAVLVATVFGARAVGLGGILEFLAYTIGLALVPTPYTLGWLAIAGGVVLGLLPAAASAAGLVLLAVTCQRGRTDRELPGG